MVNKKKLFLFSFLLSLLLIGCARLPPSPEKKGRSQVLATTAMIGDLVHRIAGDLLEVVVLIPPALDPHSYELVKGDVEKFSQSALIFYNGLGLEHGISVKKQIARCAERSLCVTAPLLEETPSSLLVIDGLYDPHVWMDISLWMKTLDPIVTALSLQFPEYKEFFVMNKQRLEKEMEEADKSAYKKLQALPEQQRYLVTSHDAFQYFTRRYLREKDEREWQRRCSAPEGLAPESELSIGDLVKVFAYIQEHNTKVLFTESNVQARGVRKLLDAGAKKGITLRLAKRPLYADSMGDALSYLQMMEHNVTVLIEELSE